MLKKLLARFGYVKCTDPIILDINSTLLVNLKQSNLVVPMVVNSIEVGLDSLLMTDLHEQGYRRLVVDVELVSAIKPQQTK